MKIASPLRGQVAVVNRAEVELQKLTDGRISELDGLLKGKEAEIMEV